LSLEKYMRYEEELLELMPMLKSYLIKIRTKYDGLVDMEDLYQECLMNAVKSSGKNGIRNPKRYFIGVFDKTIKAVSVRNIKEFQMRNRLDVCDTWEDNEVGVIEEIDMRVKDEKPATRRVWACLKLFHGNRRMVYKALGCSNQFLEPHKRRLRTIYDSILAM